ncbi:ABC transporter ATP-binding protein [Syntrophobotulus glycolicus]|nr:ABC transporter ATP-binding protein [Syntrophobotulus glycolicus]
MKALHNISVGETKKLIKPVIWMSIVNFVNMIPFILIAVIVHLIFDYYSGAPVELSMLWKLWGGMVLCFALMYVCQNKAMVITFLDGYSAAADGRIRLAEHIRKLPMGYLTSKDSGELGNMMMVDFDQTERAMTHILPQLISSIVVSVISIFLLFFLDWRLSLATFAGLPIAVLVLWGVSGLERKINVRLSYARIKQSNRLQEYLTGMKEIKAYNLQGANFSAFREACEDYRDACIRAEGVIGPINLVSSVFLKAGLSLITITGVFLLLGGSLEISVLALFLIVGTRIFDPLTTVIMRLSELKSCHVSGKRVTALFEQPVMGGTDNLPESHDIRFEHVIFGYGNDKILDDVSIVMKEGEMTAIVGPSGSGKTTVLRLAARFYDPQSGKVLFGGKNEAEIDPEKLMSKISMVFQDVYLFKDTILNNIRYGRENATREEIEAAAKAARCYDFVVKLPQGFETMVGEGGSTLSGGEKQRLSIARAILKDAPVILLDEATSSLDPENEIEIQKAINHLVQGRTVIMIAHRLKTIAGADKIVVLDRGQVVEEGKHSDLLHKGGLYANLWQLQTQMSGWKIGRMQ